MVILLPCVAQFVVVLDATIVAIALPAMQADLGFSAAALGWVLTAYTLVFGGGLMAAGRVADKAGRRRTFAAGLVLFAAASLACGLAPSAAALLAARAVQGLGAALVSPAALALVTAACPDGRAHARAMGWWTAAAAGGGASGWVLGGVLTGVLGWRWVFLVNLPLCLAAAALAPRVLAEWRDPSPARPDFAGALVATAGLGALVLGLTLVETGGSGAVAALAAAVVLLAALPAVEARARHPLLDRGLLRRVGPPSAVAAVLTGTTSPAMVLCTFHAEHVLGLAPAAAGLLFPPFNLAVVAGSLLGPRVVAAAGARRSMTGGLLGVAGGALALKAIAPSAPAFTSLLGGFVLMGAALGVASVASTGQGMRAAGPDAQGLASGLLATAAQLGTALGLAVIIPLATAHTRDGAAAVAGFERGFVAAAGLAAAAALTVALLGRRQSSPAASSAPEASKASI